MTTPVTQLIDENDRLKQQILQLSAELRSLKATPGSAVAFVEEIEALSGAIKTIRAESDKITLEQARKRVSDSAALYEKHRQEDAALPSAVTRPSSSGGRLARLEDSMLTDDERKALRAQRDRLKASLDENFGAARIDAMVEEELAKKRKQKAQQHERQYQSIRDFNAAHSSATARKIQTGLEEKAAAAEAAAAATPRREKNNAELDDDDDDVLSPAHIQRFPCIPREREERQQLLIANSTPLRIALRQAQESAIAALRRDFEIDEQNAAVSSTSVSSPERMSEVQRKKQQLAELERQHHESVQRGYEAAAAISV